MKDGSDGHLRVDDTACYQHDVSCSRKKAKTVKAESFVMNPFGEVVR